MSLLQECMMRGLSRKSGVVRDRTGVDRQVGVNKCRCGVGEVKCCALE